MKTFVQPGRSITVAAPAGGVISGDGVLLGNLCRGDMGFTDIGHGLLDVLCLAGG
jgi:predicted RecA/RadA family phage recombinase